MQTDQLNLEQELFYQSDQDSKQLFDLYRSLHFIYPAKMEKLNPVFNIVEENWEKATKLDFPLFWAVKTNPNVHNIISTGTQWQYLNHGLLGQHLASNNPVGSRITFLKVLKRMIKEQDGGSINSYQVYYRPQNKYSSRVFEQLALKAGRALSEVIPLNYFEVPFLTFDRLGEIEITEVTDGNNQDFINFVLLQRGSLFVNVQELASPDINLKKLNDRFKCFGLKRRRRIFVARSQSDHKIHGAIIVNESSLGLNFSFFENHSELILSKESAPEILLSVSRRLLFAASQSKLSSPLKWLPVMTDPLHSSIIEKLNGKCTRNYNLFMILKGGYEIWYDHIDQLTNSVYQRFINNSYEKYS